MEKVHWRLGRNRGREGTDDALCLSLVRGRRYTCLLNDVPQLSSKTIMVKYGMLMVYNAVPYTIVLTFDN